LLKIQLGSGWSNTFFATKRWIFNCLVAAMVLSLVMPLTQASANGVTNTISIDEIQGLTRPEADQTPVQSITETDEYTGTVLWSDSNGPLEVGDKFEASRVYAATITLSPKDGYTLDGVDQDYFYVAGSSKSSNDENSGLVTAIFTPIAFDASIFLDETFGPNGSGSFSLQDVFGPSPLNDNGMVVGPVKVDRIAVDSIGRIVVLASFYDELDVYNHILFRLKDDGSYDDTFAPGAGPSLRKNSSDQIKKRYVLVTTTCANYSEETVDLEIDANNKILVLLSGGPGCGGYHNLIARYDANGSIDALFGEEGEGVIGSFDRQTGPADFLFADFTVDSLGNILVASIYGSYPEVMIERFTLEGLIDEDFGGNLEMVLAGRTYVEIGFGESPFEIVNVQIIADNATPGGYLLAATGFNGYDPFTDLTRLDEFGDEVYEQDFTFGIFGSGVQPQFFLTDIFPDNSGFIMSGTYFDAGDLYGAVLRINSDGTSDLSFSPVTNNDPLLNPLVSDVCFNTALLRNDSASQLEIGVMVGNYCESGGSVKAFFPTTPYQTEFSFSIGDTSDGAQQFVTELKATGTGKIITLRGARPSKGFAALNFGGDSNYNWANATISQYHLLSTPISDPTISSVSPSSGSTAGATAITVTGTNFVVGATVTIDGAACTNVVVVTATTITCTTPAGSAGGKNVVVTNTDTGATTFISGFTYTAPVTASNTPVLSRVSSYDFRFTVQVTNYDAAFTYAVTTTTGQASINSTGLVSVTGLRVDQSATVTVTTTRVGYGTGSASVTGRSQVAPMIPTNKPLITVSATSIMCTIGSYSATPTSSAFSLYVDGKHVSTIFSATGEYLPDWIAPWATSSTITRTGTLTSASWVMLDAYQGKSITCSTLAYSKHAIGLILSGVVVIN
jgi:hypothetical protein